MLNDFLLRILPFWIPSNIVYHVDLGETFRDDHRLYRLLYRDAIKAKVVESNWWTDLWWGGTIGNKGKIAN